MRRSVPVRKTIRVELFEGLSVLVMSVYDTHLNFTGVQTRISVRAARCVIDAF